MREYITPEQDPEAVVGECLHRLRTAVNDLARLAANPATREQVLREASEIQFADMHLHGVTSFTRSRIPMEAAE